MTQISKHVAAWRYLNEKYRQEGKNFKRTSATLNTWNYNDPNFLRYLIAQKMAGIQIDEAAMAALNLSFK